MDLLANYDEGSGTPKAELNGEVSYSGNMTSEYELMMSSLEPENTGSKPPAVEPPSPEPLNADSLPWFSKSRSSGGSSSESESSSDDEEDSGCEDENSEKNESKEGKENENEGSGDSSDYLSDSSHGSGDSKAEKEVQPLKMEREQVKEVKESKDKERKPSSSSSHKEVSRKRSRSRSKDRRHKRSSDRRRSPSSRSRDKRHRHHRSERKPGHHRSRSRSKDRHSRRRASKDHRRREGHRRKRSSSRDAHGHSSRRRRHGKSSGHNKRRHRSRSAEHKKGRGDKGSKGRSSKRSRSRSPLSRKEKGDDSHAAGGVKPAAFGAGRKAFGRGKGPAGFKEQLRQEFIQNCSAIQTAVNANAEPGGKAVVPSLMKSNVATTSAGMGQGGGLTSAILTQMQQAQKLAATGVRLPGGLTQEQMMINQRAILQATGRTREQVEAETGMKVPQYYNEVNFNVKEWAEREKKRKTLFKKKPVETEAPKPSQFSATSLLPGADGETASKFARLLGVKKHGGKDGSASPPGHVDRDEQQEAERQGHLMQDLSKSYDTARVYTHLARGSGLGYSSTMYQPLG